MNNFNITGTYKFKQEDKVIYESHNLITFYGLIYFLNRCINDEFTPIQYISIGNGEAIPTKEDIKLGNELYRTKCYCEADINEKIIRLTASFDAREIIGITEIGVYNNKYLISHDTFKEIESNMLINPIGSVEVEYTYHFSTATIRQGWKQYTNANGKSIYWIYEPNNVLGLSEENTGTGYHKQTNINNLETHPGSYYYDSNMKNLYVHLRNEDINAHDLLIQTK